MARTPDEIAKMRRAGAVVHEMHERIRGAIRPGTSTGELDALAREVLAEHHARSNFLGYRGFPAVICASPNDVVVHGIPGEYVLAAGDLISIDCGAVVGGYHADAAFTMAVGEVDPVASSLVEVTEQALAAAVAQLRPGRRMGDVGHAVQSVVEAARFHVVDGYVGHGIGTQMHEPPDVPNVGRPGRGRPIQVGDVFAVEPMVTVGGADTILDDDGWTVRSADGSLAAHWEHTIAVTADGPEILTGMPSRGT